MLQFVKKVLLVLSLLIGSVTACFGAPALTSVTPSSGIQGATLNLTLTGSGFGADTTVAFSGTGAITNGIRLTNSNSLVANVTLLGDSGLRTILVTGGGTSNALAFEILPTPLSNRSDAIVNYFTGPEGGIGSRDARGTAARFYGPSGIWADGGNLYVADVSNFTIRKVSIATADVTTVAGSPQQTGFVAGAPQQTGYSDGIGVNARFGVLGAIWSDGSNLYVQDACTIRKVVIATGEVSTFVGVFRDCGTVDGPREVARLQGGGPMWGDGAYLYWIDPAVSPIHFERAFPATIRIISLTTGDVRSIPLPRIADNLSPTAIWGKDGYLYTTWSSSPGSIAMARVNVDTQTFEWLFNSQPPCCVRFAPAGLWFDGRDSFYFVEKTTLRRLTLSTGEITSIATLPPARFNGPVAVTGSGDDLYVTDRDASIISRIHLPTHEVTVFAGLQSNTPLTPRDNVTPASGFVGGAWGDGRNLYAVRDNNILLVDLATSTTTVFADDFASPRIWGDGEFLYVADPDNNRIQRVNRSTGARTTLSTVSKPRGIWGDSTSLYVTGASAVWRITKATGEVIIFAGNPGQAAVMDGIGTDARFRIPAGIWGDSTYLYIADFSDTIRRIRISTAEVTTLATQSRIDNPAVISGDGTNLYVDFDVGIKRIVIATGEVTTFAEFVSPVWGDQQSLYIRDSRGTKLDRIVLATGELSRVYPPLEFSEGIVPADRIRVNVSWTDGEFLYGLSGAAAYKVRIGTGEITHIAGALAEIGYVDGVGNHARFLDPSSLWGDGTYLYVIDHQRIRRINIATRQVDTPLGGFTPGRVWGDGRYLYLTDKYYRSIERASVANRQIVRVAGDPADDPSGPPQFADGIGTAARFRDIGPIWGDGTNLYVGDGCSIRKVVISTFEVTTFVGVADACAHVDGPRDVARFKTVNDIWGNGRFLFVATPHTIRTVDLLTGETRTIAGDAVLTGTENGNASDARFVGPERVMGDGVNLYVSDNGIRKISFAASSQSFNIPPNGINYFAAGSTDGAMSKGYARLQAAAGSQNANGIAIFSYRSNGVLVGETSVQASSLIQAGRIYAETVGAVRTGIAIANPNTTAATVSFYFTDKDGRTFGSGATTIAPNQQIASFLDETPFNGSPAAQAFSFTSSVPVGAVALRGFVNERSDFLMTTLPIAPIPSSSTAPVVLPHFAAGGGWTTQILLVNPTDESINGSVNWDAASTFYSIAPRSATKAVISDGGAQVRIGVVTVAPASGKAAPVVSSAFTFISGRVTVTESGVPATDIARSFRVFAEYDFARTLKTGIAITNIGSNPAIVQFELLDLSGQPTGYSGSTAVGANGHLAVFLNELPGFQNLPAAFRGVLRISSNIPISAIALRERYNERGDFLISTTPALADNAAAVGELMFPHLVTGSGYTTEVILMSPGATSSGTLLLRSQSGTDLPLPLVR